MGQLGKTSVALMRMLLQGRAPGQLIIQYTDQCNAHCPQCGMRVSHQFPRKTLETDKTAAMIRSAAQKGIKALSFTGGEPFLHLPQICDLAQVAGQSGIEYIRTGTNGFLFCNSGQADFTDRMEQLADQLAATPLRNIWVSIDSSDVATHEQMRGLPGVIKGLEKALPIFAERGLYLSANLGINRNFYGADKDHDHLDYDFFYAGFDQFYRFVKNLGFTIANVCYPMYNAVTDSDQAVYAATASDRVVNFSRAEKINLFQALSDCIPVHREKIRIFTPRCSIHTLLHQYRGHAELSTPCRGGIDFFFIDSQNGHTYPCGYRGDEDLGDFSALNIHSVENRKECRQCDWECFRDPSELFSPLTGLRQSPLQLLQRWRNDRRFFQLWLEDLRYYRRCHYFNGRELTNVEKTGVCQRIKKRGYDETGQ
ncbi:Radical SAM superfamily enzyme, MoaA/NifB/PqqE/SkfB family [Desulfuromusa kysingii]|uniref:Radical SAM superfamily enzyme, MoaA/NifB/PqqE/SkfB family n=1 Tax=Desulfuromusa kysingii TaxID=37625 RepID=A0A1H3ZSI4_9BACT|nr:radical SAM protein [Desulfuromusa kysingii]SEA26667.1 Radical SAM superfamily enzyme, MoaA/NifB/PqqE/SkfB family [Desulfuromusa kysingii]